MFFLFQNRILEVLKLLVVMDNYLGSLAPQINALLTLARDLENEQNESTIQLLEIPVYPVFG
jgi:hypothetical protein